MVLLRSWCVLLYNDYDNNDSNYSYATTKNIQQPTITTTATTAATTADFIAAATTNYNGSNDDNELQQLQ